MWVVLFLLALLPLVFFWSDAVVEVFPPLAEFFPSKDAKVLGMGGEPTDVSSVPASYGHWIEIPSDKGYLAYTISKDGSYRLAVGCRPDTAALLALTPTEIGPAIRPNLTVNFEYGSLPLDNTGAYRGAELINAVSQFKNMYLQAEPTKVIAQFEVDTATSGQIARAVQSNCAVN